MTSSHPGFSRPAVSRRTALVWGGVLALAGCAGGSPEPEATSSSAPSSTQTSSSTSSTPPAPKGRTPIAAAGATVAFVGDSFSVGIGSMHPGKRWTTLVSEHFGWAENNVAVSGRGYCAGHEDGTDYHGQLTKLGASAPSAVVISGGWNDVAQGYTLPEMTDAARTLLRDAIHQLPHTHIVVISPLAPASGPPEQLVQFGSQLRQLTAEVGVTYLDLNMPLTGHDDWISADALHPNNRGYREIAVRVEKRLQALTSAQPTSKRTARPSASSSAATPSSSVMSARR